MANEETPTPHLAGMLMLKSTTSSLDVSYTELSSPHEVKKKLYYFYYCLYIFIYFRILEH